MDTSKVFAGGFSYGATIVQDLACLRSWQFRGFAPDVAPGDYEDIPLILGECKNTTPVSYISFCGTSDISHCYLNSIQKATAVAKQTHCTRSELRRKSATVNCTVWSGCHAGHVVESCLVFHLDHEIPGRVAPDGTTFLHPGSDLDYTKYVFEKFSLQVASDQLRFYGHPTQEEEDWKQQTWPPQKQYDNMYLRTALAGQGLQTLPNQREIPFAELQGSQAQAFSSTATARFNAITVRRHLAVFGCSNHALFLVDYARLELLRVLQVSHTTEAWALDFHPTLAILATASARGGVRFWNVADRKAAVGKVLRSEFPAWSLAFQPIDGSLLAVGMDKGLLEVRATEVQLLKSPDDDEVWASVRKVLDFRDELDDVVEALAMGSKDKKAEEIKKDEKKRQRQDEKEKQKQEPKRPRGRPRKNAKTDDQPAVEVVEKVSKKRGQARAMSEVKAKKPKTAESALSQLSCTPKKSKRSPAKAWKPSPMAVKTHNKRSPKKVYDYQTADARTERAGDALKELHGAMKKVSGFWVPDLKSFSQKCLG
eukprot:s647_g23.t1